MQRVLVGCSHRVGSRRVWGRSAPRRLAAVAAAEDRTQGLQQRYQGRYSGNQPTRGGDAQSCNSCALQLHQSAFQIKVHGERNMANATASVKSATY